jgi:hypothetical protein
MTDHDPPADLRGDTADSVHDEHPLRIASSQHAKAIAAQHQRRPPRSDGTLGLLARGPDP